VVETGALYAVTNIHIRVSYSADICISMLGNCCGNLPVYTPSPFSRSYHPMSPFLQPT
jgi:hypothetical protein